jgi:hypothetical protein
LIDCRGDYDDHEYWLVCDKCGEEEGPFERFDEAVTYKKDGNDWGSILKGGEWEDRCPNCS